VAWASIGRPFFTVGGRWIFQKAIRADLERMRATRGTTPPVPPDAYVCWTINRAREMRYLRRLGVSGILTDFPARLRHLHTRQGYQEARLLARHARQHARRSRQVTEGHVRS
jgi:hypothetical protein